MANLSSIDWLVCIAYLVLVFGLAIKSAGRQQDNEDYFFGGRKMNWFVVGVSMFATSFSSISFLGLPQRGAYQDFSFYLTILFIPFVITPILWWMDMNIWADGLVRQHKKSAQASIVSTPLAGWAQCFMRWPLPCKP
jgi:SSS family solute:Na+ symporter